MLSEAQFKQFETRHTCEPGMPYIAQKLRSSSYEFTKDIQTSATYYFVFLNMNKGPVSITLHVDGGVQTSVLTRTEEQVEYLTQVSPFVTETLSLSSHPVGFGPMFYSGIGLVVVAGIVLAIGGMKGAAPRPTQVSPVAPVAPAAPVVSPPPPESAPGKFCINCRAHLPAHATFCNRCGTKQ